MKSDNFFNSITIKSFSSAPESDLLNDKIRYHYTSPAGFLSIIQNKKIRFSDVRFMNDKSEGVYFVKILLDFLEKQKDNYPLSLEATYVLFDKENIDGIKSLRVTSIKYSEIPDIKYTPNRCFLLCAAKKPDLLNMWNYYVRDNAYEGYCIGFDIKELLQTFDSSVKNLSDPFTVYYGDVLYDRQAQIKEISDLLSYVEKIANTTPINGVLYAALTIRNYIETRGYFFKHNAFKAEEEFRIIVAINEKRFKKDKTFWLSNMKDANIEFFVRKGLIVPSFSILIPDNAISSVYLSPIVEDEIAKQGVREFIDTVGYKGVQIHKSNIPIRY